MKRFLYVGMFLLAGVTVALTSCQKDDEKKGDDTKSAEKIEVFVSTEAQSQNVLIEELTGWGCQYCPDGHKRCDELAAEYPGKVFSINVHCGNYSEGRNPEYTTDEGYTLLRTLGANGFPCGYVNRISWKTSSGSNAAYYLSRAYFKSCAEQLMNQDKKAIANIAAKATLDKASRQLTVTTQVCFTAEPNADAKQYIINVALVQNNIKGPQIGAATHYPEKWDGTQYTHNHMLRAYVTGLRGDIFEYKGTGEGNVVQKTYTYTIPETMGRGNIPAVLDDMEVICFVTNKATNASKPEDYFPLPIINVCKSEISYK